MVSTMRWAVLSGVREERRARAMRDAEGVAHGESDEVKKLS